MTSIGVNAFAFSSLTAVSIPNGLTSIGGGAFAYTPLASVSIPASVTSIGGGAFNLCISLPAITVDASNPAYCSSGPGVLFNKTQTWLLQYPLANTATSYTVPNGVTNIAEAAFDYATHLASISIPASVTNIGGQAFFECFSLTAITVDPSNPAFYSSLNSSVNGVLFDKSQTTLIQYPVGNPATSYPAMPNTLTSIGDYAFYYATNLTTLALPAGLTSIGAQTFGQCFSLAGITLPAGVTNIGYSSFFNCFSLTSITIPNLVTSIPVDLFTYCTNLTNAWIGAGVTSIGPGAFFGCSRLTSVNIPNGVTSIGAQAFQDCNNLPTVTIPATVNSIGDYAFYGDCAKLIPVYVEGNLPASMGVDVFGDPPTIYYLPGATGWATYAVASGVPVAVWQPQMLTSDGSFGVRDNQFGFNINWASGTTVVVEACTNLANSNWFGLQTNTLTGGTFYFSDPQWTNYPVCFYRVTLP